jgi:folate-dependent tRNA-U54 methylase TrmFO/GidA
MGAIFILLDLNPDMKVNSVTTDVYIEEVEFTKKNDSYITFCPMSIKNIQKFTNNLLEKQYLIIYH